VFVLVEVRGTGASNPDGDHGQQSEATSHSATQLMLGQTLLGGQLRDLRAAWRHVRKRDDIDPKNGMVAGGTGAKPLASDAAFTYPRRIDGRPGEAEPAAAHLALLLGLYEDDVGNIASRHGLVSYRAVLDSPFVQVPHGSVVPGLLAEGDLPDLVAALAPRAVAFESLVDGRGRRVPLPVAEKSYAGAAQVYADLKASDGLDFTETAEDE
jgi:hypothetical protein